MICEVLWRTVWYFLVLWGTLRYFEVLWGTYRYFKVPKGTYWYFEVVKGTLKYVWVLWGTSTNFKLRLGIFQVLLGTGTFSPDLQVVQVPPTCGNLSSQCKWCHLMVNFATSASVTHLMTNFSKTMQVALSGGWFCNQCKCRHLVNKCSTNAATLQVPAVPAVWVSSPSSLALLTVLAVQAVLLLALLLCTYRIYRALWAFSISIFCIVKFHANFLVLLQFYPPPLLLPSSFYLSWALSPSSCAAVILPSQPSNQAVGIQPEVCPAGIVGMSTKRQIHDMTNAKL